MKAKAITSSEDKFAYYLTKLGVEYLRQQVICLKCGFIRGNTKAKCPSHHKDNGVAIVDFYLPKPNSIVEIEGSIHERMKNVKKDAKRAKTLNSLGFQLFRITNDTVDKLWKSLDLQLPQSSLKAHRS